MESGTVNLKNISRFGRIALLLAFQICLVSCGRSRIVLENGTYNNILVAVKENVSQENCTALISAISETLTQTSHGLYDTLGGKARFGKIRILIPAEWQIKDCSAATVVPKEVYESYDTADIKITVDHPIAESLPWAEQHQGCGKSAEAVHVPSNFLLSAELDQHRGRIFLHEWLKFRYGVFEEFGFMDDDYYSPCYRMNAAVHFTSCTFPVVGPISSQSSVSRDECKRLLRDRNETLINELRTTSSSLMFAPKGFDGKDPSLCTVSSHNILANTKQNLQCYRKSTLQTILNHKDFASDETSIGEKAAPDTPQIEIVQPLVGQKHGYAFLIEDTDQSRIDDRWKILKQSLSEFVFYIDEKSDAKLVCAETFGNAEKSFPPRELSSISFKEAFINYFEDTPNGASLEATRILNISAALEKLTKNLEPYAQWQWNIIVVASSPPSDINSNLDLLKAMPHSISLFTFDSSTDWLSWNSLVQMRRLVYLPNCPESASCSPRLPSFLTDHMLEILGDQQPRRWFQKVVNTYVNGSTSEVAFTLPPVNVDTSSFLLSLHVLSGVPDTYAVSPSGNRCRFEPLFKHSGTLFVNSSTCDSARTYEPGNWAVTIGNSGHYILRGYIESPQDGLLVYPSFSNDLSKQVFPVLQNYMVPIHVVVKTPSGLHVIAAEVEAEIIHENSTGLSTTSVSLWDDGNDPDVTKNDGVYSGFVYGFSVSPGFHSGYVHVRTSNSSKAITGLQKGLNEAAVFDSLFASKCCGSYVPAVTSDVNSSVIPHSVVLPSFLTGETLPTPVPFPPSRINLIDVLEETDNYIDLQFVAPQSDLTGSTVYRYDLCLMCDDCLCKPIPTPNCQPVAPGDEQPCLVHKEGLLETFVNPLDLENVTGDYISIVCGIRAVNKLNVTGPMSLTVFELNLLVGNETSGMILKCDSISDDCLPIYVFWILVGCIAALVVLVLAIVICWCALTRKRKNSKSSNNDSFRLERRSIDGKILNDPFNTRPAIYSSSLKHPEEDERRQGTNGDISTVFQSRDPASNDSNELMQPDRDVEMPIFFRPETPNRNKQKPVVPKKPTQHERRYDDWRNNGSSNHAYTNPHYQTDSLNTLTLPTISSTVDVRGPEEDWGTRFPVYATVNRSARRPNDKKIANPDSHDPLRPNSRSNQVGKNKYQASRPHSADSLDSGFVRSQSQIGSPPSIRMDHFPSSESETYSEMSRGYSAPPPPPPPLPSPADLNGRNFRGLSNERSTDDSAIKAPSRDTQVRPVLTSTPTENAFSILAKMGPIPDRRTILRHRDSGPPPPPPRRNSQKKPVSDYSNVGTTVFMGRGQDNDPDIENNTSEEDDNDSDNWDVYDDFDFHPGVSHV